MKIEMIPSDVPEVQICTLYSLEDIRPYYYLSMYNLVINAQTNKYCSISCTNRGYLYVTMGIMPEGSNVWRKVTLHKIIALGRINNGPYECIEHINDNTFDLRVANLKFSTFKDNSISSFENERHVCSSAIYRVITFDGNVYEGTLKEIEYLSGIPKGTLYYRCSNGARETSLNNRQQVRSVEKIDIYEPERPITSRSIDYRDDCFQGLIQFDQLCLEKRL